VLFALLVALLVSSTALLAVPAWAHEKQQTKKEEQRTKKVSDRARKAALEGQAALKDSAMADKTPREQRQLDLRVERFLDSPAVEGASQDTLEDRLVQAAQTSNAAGDLAGDPATATPGTLGAPPTSIAISEENCTVSANATITFQDAAGNIGTVVNNVGSTITATSNQVMVTGTGVGGTIDFVDPAPDPTLNPFTVLDSSGIECSDDDDGFDDDLLLALLLALLEEDFVDDDDFDDDDFEEDIFEDIEDDIFEDVEDDIDDDAEDGVSATADEDGAEADAGGTSADAGDPDEQDPVSGPRGDVVDEIDTGGTPLPPTGGSPVATLTPLAGIALAPLVWIALLATGLSARWVRRRRQR
jgi:hypothetical protein